MKHTQHSTSLGGFAVLVGASGVGSSTVFSSPSKGTLTGAFRRLGGHPTPFVLPFPMPSRLRKSTTCESRSLPFDLSPSFIPALQHHCEEYRQ